MLVCFDKDFKVFWISGIVDDSLVIRLIIKSFIFKINKC